MFDYNGCHDVVTSSNKKYFLKLKSQQYFNQTGETLFAKLYRTIDQDSYDIFLNVIEKLLKEMKEVYDIENETSIEKVLQMNNDFYKEKILRILVNYWKVDSVNYDHYKMIISKQSSYLNLYIIMKENNKLMFEDTFPRYLNEMRFKYENDFQNIIQQDCNCLLSFMLSNNLNELMDIVITCPQFDVNKLNIETDELSIENHSITNMMTKLLDNGYYVGNDGQEQIPLDWISSQVFEKFLDSKIKEDSRYKIKIDYNFLIDPSIRKIHLNGINDRNEKLLFSSGMKAVENILNNDRLRNLITHPVLSTFISLKTKKYQLIVNTNFYIFLFCYLIPYFQLTTLNVTVFLFDNMFRIISEITTISREDIGMIYFTTVIVLCFFSTIFLTCREIVQLFLVCESKKIYLKNRSNQFQILLITLTWIYLISVINFSEDDDLQQYIIFPSALIIIFGTIELLLILPYPSMSIYMTMLQQVAKTFIKFFTIFILIIIAFTFSFCVAFSTINDLSDEKTHFQNLTFLIESNEYSSYTNGSFKELLLGFKKALTSLENTDNVFQNFDSPLTSFVKTLQMLAGDNLDPYSLNTKSRIFLYFIFILTSFVLFNLINGLAISDIQILKQQAEYLNLKKQIRNGAECEGIICKLYNKTRFVNSKYECSN